jgi:hypothetical protein
MKIIVRTYALAAVTSPLHHSSATTLALAMDC